MTLNMKYCKGWAQPKNHNLRWEQIVQIWKLGQGCLKHSLCTLMEQPSIFHSKYCQIYVQPSLISLYIFMLSSFWFRVNTKFSVITLQGVLVGVQGVCGEMRAMTRHYKSMAFSEIDRGFEEFSFLIETHFYSENLNHQELDLAKYLECRCKWYI